MNNIFNTSLLESFKNHISNEYTEKYFNEPIESNLSFTNDLKSFCKELVNNKIYRPIIEYYIYLYLTALQEENNSEVVRFLYNFTNDILPELEPCNEIICRFFLETDATAIAENKDYIERFNLSFKEFSEEYWNTMGIHEAYSLIGNFLARACSPLGNTVSEKTATITDSNRTLWANKGIRYSKALKNALAHWS